MPEFLSFLLTILLVWYIIRALARILVPMFFQSVINKAQQQQNHQQNYSQPPPQDKVKVDYMPKSIKGAVPDSEGEFVDY
ncbi:MAG: hypothetical protein M3N14_08440, partial [Bacteroidota bacterium]|nr:hypothetical protein [Bacteroidota bacterium]